MKSEHTVDVNEKDIKEAEGRNYALDKGKTVEVKKEE